MLHHVPSFLQLNFSPDLIVTRTTYYHSAVAAPRTTAISVAEMAQERLEKFQIRRENQALLKRINSIGSQREKDLEDIRQKYEAALETNTETLARIEELEQKVAARDREVDEFVEELQRFKGTVEEFLRTRASKGWTMPGFSAVE